MDANTTSQTWLQNYDPFGSYYISGAIAVLPILLFFASLVIFKLKGWQAALLTVLSSIAVAIFAYKMPFMMVIMSFAQGFLTGLWPIAWIILAAIFLYKLTIKTGYFDILKQSVTQITPDYRIQVILIAFCFGSFLEGAIGFGGPVAITAALLVGLGLRPLYAAGLCMIANTAPVAFGAVGIPIIALGNSVGVSPDIIAAMTGRMLVPITIFVPFFMVILMDGLRGIKELYPVVLVASISFVIVQFLSSNYLGAELPDIISAIVSIAATSLFLTFWQPKNIRTIDGGVVSEVQKHHICKVLVAWAPFVLLVSMIIIWSLPAFKALANEGFLKATTLVFSFSGLDNLIMQNTPIVNTPTPLGATFKWDIIASSGSAIFIAGILSIFVLRARATQVAKAASETIKEMSIPVVTIGLVLAFAYIAKNSGQAATLGIALSHSGGIFAFFSPIIGWIGVFLTGSDTSSNLLFGTLQQVTAQQLGIEQSLFLAANSVGGVVGKMISPQSIAIACAAVGLVGQESALFRFTVKYSIMFVVGIGVWTLIILHFIPAIIVSSAL